MNKKLFTKFILTAVVCLIFSVGNVVYAAAPTVAYNFEVTVDGDKGTAYTTEALKTSANDYATIKVSSLNNQSYGVWMRMDKGPSNSRTTATSEQKFTTITTKNSFYLSGMKSVGSTYVVVGRLAPGSSNVKVSGTATP